MHATLRLRVQLCACVFSSVWIFTRKSQHVGCVTAFSRGRKQFHALCASLLLKRQSVTHRVGLLSCLNFCLDLQLSAELVIACVRNTCGQYAHISKHPSPAPAFCVRALSVEWDSTAGLRNWVSLWKAVLSELCILEAEPWLQPSTDEGRPR